MNGMTYIGMACHFLRDVVCDTAFSEAKMAGEGIHGGI